MTEENEEAEKTAEPIKMAAIAKIVSPILSGIRGNYGVDYVCAISGENEGIVIQPKDVKSEGLMNCVDTLQGMQMHLATQILCFVSNEMMKADLIGNRFAFVQPLIDVMDSKTGMRGLAQVMLEYITEFKGE